MNMDEKIQTIPSQTNSPQEDSTLRQSSVQASSPQANAGEGHTKSSGQAKESLSEGRSLTAQPKPNRFFECECSCNSCEYNDRCFITQEEFDSLHLERLPDDPEMMELKTIFQALQSPSCEDVYELYCDDANERGHEPLNEREFGKIIRRKFPQVKRVRIRRSGRLVYVYRGLSAKLSGEGRKLFESIREKRRTELGLI